MAVHWPMQAPLMAAHLLVLRQSRHVAMGTTALHAAALWMWGAACSDEQALQAAKEGRCMFKQLALLVQCSMHPRPRRALAWTQQCAGNETGASSRASEHAQTWHPM